MVKMSKQFSTPIKKRLSALKKIEKSHLQLGMKMFAAYNGAVYGLDMYAYGAIKRSMANCSAFRLLLTNRNFITAASVLRIQLDNALRFYASFLVSKPHEFAIAVLNGTPVRDLKDRNGKKMRDQYLVDCLSKEYPWIPKVYKETSGYIHFSKKHIFNAINGVDEKNHSAKIEISSKDINLPDAIYIEALDAFMASTDIFLRYLTGWIITKNNPDIENKNKTSQNIAD